MSYSDKENGILTLFKHVDTVRDDTGIAIGVQRVGDIGKDITPEQAVVSIFFNIIQDEKKAHPSTFRIRDSGKMTLTPSGRIYGHQMIYDKFESDDSTGHMMRVLLIAAVDPDKKLVYNVGFKEEAYKFQERLVEVDAILSSIDYYQEQQDDTKEMNV